MSGDKGKAALPHAEEQDEMEEKEQGGSRTTTTPTARDPVYAFRNRSAITTPMRFRKEEAKPAAQDRVSPYPNRRRNRNRRYDEEEEEDNHAPVKPSEEQVRGAKPNTIAPMHPANQQNLYPPDLQNMNPQHVNLREYPSVPSDDTALRNRATAERCNETAGHCHLPTAVPALLVLVCINSTSLLLPQASSSSSDVLVHMPTTHPPQASAGEASLQQRNQDMEAAVLEDVTSKAK